MRASTQPCGRPSTACPPCARTQLCSSLWPWSSILSVAPRQHVVLVLVDRAAELARDHHGGGGLLDDSRPLDDVSGQNLLAVIDRRIDVAPIEAAGAPALKGGDRASLAALHAGEGERRLGRGRLEAQGEHLDGFPRHREGVELLVLA